MFSSAILLAATAMTGLVSAQSPWTFATSYSTSGPIAINPDTVDPALRATWCRAETESCRQICSTYSANTCDSNTLTYNCTCATGSTPNITDFQQTLPFFICQQWITDCVAGHPNDLDGITACHSVTCGDRNASSASSSSSSSSSASSTSSAAASSSSGAAASATSAAASATSGAASAASSAAAATSSSAASSAAIGVAMNYGTGVLAAGMLAVFGLAL
ncbi:hypothetical protein AAFC00_003795 [Neodothiora populina]|uniref:DUF7707 domain-containing protein n=1 Tax=Neodothiora populina TaxID=2781224 RepID=A0ABR3PFE2_9PEZI